MRTDRSNPGQTDQETRCQLHCKISMNLFFTEGRIRGMRYVAEDVKISERAATYFCYLSILGKLIEK